VKEKFDLARKVMVDNQIRPVGVTNLSLLESLGQVKREKFVPNNKQSIAYSDGDIKISSSKYLMAPASFARLAQLADIKSDDIILVVGCVTGYSVAAIAPLCNAVVGIEADETLVNQANETLSDLDIGNSAILAKDLSQGVPSEAPFDVILIEGAVDEVPLALLRQLRDGAHLVAVISGNQIGKATKFVKTGNDISKHIAFDIVVPTITSLSKPKAFAL
jgi:protein-L-isoaspartate(D-aspartate) O-methyltransferase